jgi:hypothetical protein
MSATFTVSITLPACTTRDIELALVERALEICAQRSRSAGGQVTSGNVADGPLLLGSYTYTPVAPS